MQLSLPYLNSISLQSILSNFSNQNQLPITSLKHFHRNVNFFISFLRKQSTCYPGSNPNIWIGQAQCKIKELLIERGACKFLNLGFILQNLHKSQNFVQCGDASPLPSGRATGYACSHLFDLSSLNLL